MNANQDTTAPVGQNIRTLRIQSGWSLKDAATRLGISTSALSKIETGITDVNLSRLEQIADIYSVNLVQLWVLDFENKTLQASKLNIAKKKVSDLESEISTFQRKVIQLYEKLRQQSANLQPIHG
jgi:transcriptional regulator with XRE-family HTH domain